MEHISFFEPWDQARCKTESKTKASQKRKRDAERKLCEKDQEFESQTKELKTLIPAICKNRGMPAQESKQVMTEVMEVFSKHNAEM